MKTRPKILFVLYTRGLYSNTCDLYSNTSDLYSNTRDFYSTTRDFYSVLDLSHIPVTEDQRSSNKFPNFPKFFRFVKSKL